MRRARESGCLSVSSAAEVNSSPPARSNNAYELQLALPTIFQLERKRGL